ncbi:MAG: HAD family hydrolase [Chakrabartia sp.]
MAVAIFDLDRTLTKYATYTPFLIFAAFHRAPWRLLLLPVWLVSMIGYGLRVFSRKRLKEIGFLLLVGRQISTDKIDKLAADFADLMVNHNIFPAAQARLAQERAQGAKLILATASPDFYAQEIANRLGFDEVIATRQDRPGPGLLSYRIAGGNCYGAAKLDMVRTALAKGTAAKETRFYSDSASDAPLLEWVDSAFAVNPDTTLRRLARLKGWSVLDFA